MPLGGHFVVAGPGFAPGAEGYEPSEILLLHPAIVKTAIIILSIFQKARFFCASDGT